MNRNIRNTHKSRNNIWDDDIYIEGTNIQTAQTKIRICDIGGDYICYIRRDSRSTES